MCTFYLIFGYVGIHRAAIISIHQLLNFCWSFFQTQIILLFLYNQSSKKKVQGKLANGPKFCCTLFASPLILQENSRICESLTPNKASQLNCFALIHGLNYSVEKWSLSCRRCLKWIGLQGESHQALSDARGCPTLKAYTCRDLRTIAQCIYIFQAGSSVYTVSMCAFASLLQFAFVWVVSL